MNLTDQSASLTLPSMVAPGNVGLDHQLSYNPKVAAKLGASTGQRWMAMEQPAIWQNAFTGRVTQANGWSQVSLEPEPDGVNYKPLFGAQVRQTFKHVPEVGVFQQQDRYGGGVVTTRYHDFDQPAYRAGRIISVTDQNGRVTTAEGYGLYGIQELRKTVAGVHYSLVYAYFESGDQTGNLQYVTLQKQVGDLWTNLRRTEYLYYDGTELHGSLNDLKAAKQQEWTGTEWSDVAVSYMRYYVAGELAGNPHDLKYFVNPQAYAQLVQAGTDPLTDPSADVPQYATLFYEYTAGIVSRNTVRGVSGATGEDGQTWTRTPNPMNPAHGYNTWSDKLTLVLADRNTRIKFVNWLGLTMLDVLQQVDAPSRQWCTFYKYDDDGHVVLQADPAAVIGYDESKDDLLDFHDGRYAYLRDDAGLIRLTSYYTSTTATSGTAGGVKGYEEATSLKQGQDGAEIKQSHTNYIASDDAHTGATVYLAAEVETYPKDSGATVLTTTLEYLWYTAPARVKQKTTIWPIVSTGENGTGEEESRKSYFDANGNVTWTMCELGMISKFEYDESTGLLIRKIVDVGDDAHPPEDWEPRDWDHQNITTDYSYDAEGRRIRTLGPEFQAVVTDIPTMVRKAEWTVYKEAPTGDQTWSGEGFASGAGYATYTLVNPVRIVFSDKKGLATDVVTAARPTVSGALSASDTFLRRDWTGWSHADYNDAALKVAERVYHNIPASCSGLEGVNQEVGESAVNYDETTFAYDPQTNQLLRIVSPGGTITQNEYDPIRRLVGVYQGTDDDNLVQVSASVYDDGDAGGDSNVTRTTQFVDDSTSRVTDYTYDFRNRRITTDGAVDYFQELTYDNMNRVVVAEQRDTSAAGHLVAKNETFYDARNRVYRTLVWGVNPDSTTPPTIALIGNNYYDAVSHLVRAYAPGGGDSYTAYTYDTVGRRVRTLQCYGPPNVAGEVIEKQKLFLDKADHVLYTITSLRNTDSDTMRDSYVANWYDGAGRLIARANYGAVDSFMRPASVPGFTEGDELVDTLEYDDAGRVFQTSDPMEIAARTEYDDAGRVIRKIDNYQEDPAPGDDSANRTTETAYNADGKVLTVTLKMNSLADDQTTTYTYGTTLADSDIASSQLRRSEQYADSSGAGDRIEFTYNRQGQVTSRKDQLGTVHAYGFDALGRPTQDIVTVLGAGVDAGVRRIDTAYEVRGLAAKLTSCADVDAETVVNEVKLEYNDFRQLVTDYQSHSGAVNTATSLKVQYAFADGSANQVRPLSLTYPDGREIGFDYGMSAGMDDHLNRLQAIKEGGAALASYKYLGLSTVVRQDLPEPSVRFDLWGGTEGVYVGLDQFMRPIQVLWQQYGGASADLVKLLHTYDRDSNRLTRKNVVATAAGKKLDQIYAYDRLNRLRDMQRGLLNSEGTAMAEKAFEQLWNLDKAGNWSTFDQDDTGDGTWNLEQQRLANKGNEIVDITATTGPTWATPQFDPVGNMTFIPKPEAPEEGFEGVYDAWNRLVKAKDGGATLAEYAYDGRNYRTSKALYENGSQTSALHYYYTSRWQVVEERLATPTPYDLQQQYVWGIGINQLILRDRAVDGSPTLNERLYALQDSHFDVTCIVDTDGQALERYEYEAYGKPRVLDADFEPRETSDFVWEVLYSGYLLDAETNLYYVRYRYYHDTLGQWITRDPLFDSWGGHMLGNGAGVAKSEHRYQRPGLGSANRLSVEDEISNVYSFTRNSPTASFDIDGLLTENGCQTAIGNALMFPKARKIIGLLKSHRPPCTYPDPKCICCGDADKGGSFDPATKTISICADKLRNGQQVIEAIIHELVHALDDCRGIDWDDCSQRACAEIRAADQSGQCAKGGAWRLPTEGYRDCIRRVATKSTTADSDCSGADVDAQLSRCIGMKL